VASYIYKNFTQKEASVARGEQIRPFDPAQLQGARPGARRGPGPYAQYEARLAAEKQPMIECHYPGINFAIYLWSRSLPLLNGQVNPAFLDYMKQVHSVMPAAVDTCPAKFYDADALQKY
jgi:hypothetical protein